MNMDEAQTKKAILAIGEAVMSLALAVNKRFVKPDDTMASLAKMNAALQTMMQEANV